jgi:4-amino-4-deoxy-L-arabinose transferase-like glycosyltransferase
MLLGAAMVVLTYLFARDVAGRWPAAIAAGLLLTSGGHIIINSHTARSNSTTPLLTTAAIWLIYRALEDRRWDWVAGGWVARRPDPRLLAPAGLLVGLALQTHLSVIALLPGLAAYAVWRGRRLLRTPWPYLAGVGVLLGYANMLVYNLLNDFWSLRHASSLQSGYTGGRATDVSYYLTNFGALVQSLARLLSGTIETDASPARFVYSVLAIAGLVLLARRGGLLLVLAAASIVVVLPYFNPRYGPILSGRYLIPLLPLGFLAIGCVVVASARWVNARTSARRARWVPVAAGAFLALALFPLLALTSYYREVLLDGRTNEPLHQLSAAIVAGREPGELVLLDEGLAQEQLGAGGTDLKAFRMLLGTHGVPHEITKVADVDQSLFESVPSVLLLAETKKRQLLPRALRTASIGPEVESASGTEHRYGVYRVTLR